MFMIFHISPFRPTKNYNLYQTQRPFVTGTNKAHDVYAPSFCAQTSNTQFEDELKNLDGIRCARCNRHTLSEKKYQLLLEQISQVKDGHELEKFLTDNKQYISESNLLMLKDLQDINKKHPDANINLILKKIHYHAPRFYKQTCQDNINLLKLVTEKLIMSDKNKEIYLNTAQKLAQHKEFLPYNIMEFSSIMNETLRETDYPRKQKLYDKVMLHQTKAYKYYKDITRQYLINKEPHEALTTIGKILFKKSVSKISPISKRDETSDINKILVCTDCAHNTENSGRYFKAKDSAEKLKNNFTQYFQDITKAKNNNEIHFDNEYLHNLVKYVGRASKYTITFNQNDWSFLNYKTNFATFPFENIEGLPCPKCNGTMLTFEQKEKILKKIHESTSIKELNDLLKENKQYLPPLGKKLAENFNKNFLYDPYITDSIMKRNMTTYTSKFLTHELRCVIKTLQEKITSEKLTQNDKLKLNKIINELKEYDREQKRFLNSSKLKQILLQPPISDQVDRLNLHDYTENFLTKIELIQGPAYHSRELYEAENYNWSKVFIERIFRKAVITQDHLIARNNGGSDTIDNKIALHRECNQLKGRQTIAKWLTNNPQIEDNMANYLRKINEKIKDGKIKDCDNYAKEIANKIFYLCGGKDKLSKEFGKNNSL